MPRLPVLSFPALYHVGTLNLAHRGEQAESLEGHMLSVSTCPSAWRDIVNLSGRPLHALTRPEGIKLLDVVTLMTEPKALAHVEDWALSRRLVEHRTLWRAWNLDTESGTWTSYLFDNKEDAEEDIEDEEAGGPDGKPAVDQLTILAGTSTLEQLVKRRNLSRIRSLDLAAAIWVDETQPHLDGVYWQHPNLPRELPRGGILPSRLDELSIRTISWSRAPADVQFRPVTYETVSQEHGAYRKQSPGVSI